MYIYLNLFILFKGTVYLDKYAPTQEQSPIVSALVKKE